MKSRKLIRKSLIFVTFMTFMTMTVNAVPAMAAEDHYLHDVYISVDGQEARTVRAVDCEYRNNVYVSLKDMAELLKGSTAAIDVNVTGDTIEVISGNSQNARSLSGWQEEEKSAFTAKEATTNSFSFNGSERKYYNLRAAYEEGVDCFIRPITLCMMLDINVEDVGENTYNIDTSSILKVSPNELEANNYFDDVNAALIGDATTGEIFYEYKGDEAFPIASTTKLMTYLLTQDAISAGQFTEDDYVTISAEAASVSISQDGTTPMTEGAQVTVRELILGALLPSSNECALLLGDKVGGDKNTFVSMMNDKAAELGMTTARFYNANGLPDYNQAGIPSKKQNHMSAEDMFKLCAHILNTYPQVKDVTHLTDASLTSLHKDVKNTNALIYNMPEVNGLKTGTTTKAGACLVTSLTVNDGTEDHDLVVVLLGAENSKVRFTTSELLAYFGKNVVLGKLSADGKVLSAPDDAQTATVEITASSIVDMVVRNAMRNR